MVEEEKKHSNAEHGNTNYEVQNPKQWKHTMQENDLLFKFYDYQIQEVADVKKIKDEQIFPDHSLT